MKRRGKYRHSPTVNILFDHPSPFAFAHGGFQTQIEQTKRAVEKTGATVEWLRWWDAEQRGDLVHYFGRPNVGYVEHAHAKGMKVVVGELLTGLGSRKPLARAIQRRVTAALKNLAIFSRMGWRTYEVADLAVALTPWEAQLMAEIFNAPRERIHVVPNGVEEVFLHSAVEERGPWLVCTATITERKRVLELAEAAVAGKVPVWIIGRPYSEADEYYRAFKRLSEAQPNCVRYEGGVSSRAELAKIYRQSRGFVLLSEMESLSLSALEASACRCPLFLSDLPWARTTFEAFATYCPVTPNAEETGRRLKAFYDGASNLPLPPLPKTWDEVGVLLRSIYEKVLPETR